MLVEAEAHRDVSNLLNARLAELGEYHGDSWGFQLHWKDDDDDSVTATLSPPSSRYGHWTLESLAVLQKLLGASRISISKKGDIYVSFDLGEAKL